MFGCHWESKDKKDDLILSHCVATPLLYNYKAFDEKIVTVQPLVSLHTQTKRERATTFKLEETETWFIPLLLFTYDRDAPAAASMPCKIVFVTLTETGQWRLHAQKRRIEQKHTVHQPFSPVSHPPAVVQVINNGKQRHGSKHSRSRTTAQKDVILTMCWQLGLFLMRQWLDSR